MEKDNNDCDNNSKLEIIAKNKLELIRNQINLEELEICQNQAKIKRLNAHANGKTKKDFRFWSENHTTQSKNIKYVTPSIKVKKSVKGKDIFSEVQTNKINKQHYEKFYGLAKSGKNKKQILIQTDSRSYQSKYAQANEFKDENNEFKPVKMTTLVTEPKNEIEDLTSLSSECEKEIIIQSDSDIKLQRLGAINKIKVDEKNKKRNRRMFNFMQKHLKDAQKEHRFKKNTTLKLIYLAKELREKQNKFVRKKFKESQIEKYFKRTQQRQKKIKHLEWKYRHNENILLANNMKSEFLKCCDMLNTKSEPIIFFRPNINENELQNVFKSEIILSSSRLQIILEKRLKIMLETEGQCPTDPDSLFFENDLHTFDRTITSLNKQK